MHAPINHRKIMKFNCLGLLLLVALLTGFRAQAAGSGWDDWKGLLGNWVAADSAGKPGKASGGDCSFTMELQGATIVRKNHAGYPATKDRPASNHDDLMVIFHRGDAVRAAYYDSEGHEINYSAAFKASEKSWTFLSDSTPGAPRYRLTYTQASPTELKLRFEVAAPDKPDAFHTYIEATLKRPVTSTKP